MGWILLVRLDATTERPLIVSAVTEVDIYGRGLEATPTGRELRVSGVLICEPSDHNLPALRGGAERQFDPARLHGRPDRSTPYVYAECLRLGTGLGEAHAR